MLCTSNHPSHPHLHCATFAANVKMGNFQMLTQMSNVVIFWRRPAESPRINVGTAHLCKPGTILKLYLKIQTLNFNSLFDVVGLSCLTSD